MHAFLIVGGETGENIKTLVKKLRAKPIEFSVSKVEDVRELNSFTSLLVASPQAIILRNIENSTSEALNALLKNLEEPAENIFYILTCQNLSQVLPTIVSRCEIVKIKNPRLPDGQEKSKIKNEGAEEFMNMKISKKFSYLDKIKTRDEALTFVRNLIIFLHPQLISHAKRIRICQQVFNNLKANGNVNIQLTYLAINQL
ncbi:MAG: hypothetical protein ABSA43_00775 [Candidatus Microgenomates bacterium]|jgi:DNA polymerase III delta prime subunit